MSTTIGIVPPRHSSLSSARLYPKSAGTATDVAEAPSASRNTTRYETSMAAPNQPGAPGLRYPSNKKTIYDRNLNRTKNAELSRAAFAYLFVEMISYAQKHVRDIAALEKRYVLRRSS
jgi:hypothetical protein